MAAQNPSSKLFSPAIAGELARCTAAGCSNRLAPKTKSGYCHDHAYLASRATLGATLRDCEYKGGIDKPETYRPAQPCLGKFHPDSHNQKNCAVCKPFARLAHNAVMAAAKYQADTKKAAEIALTNRHKRRKDAGDPVRPIGRMQPCEYRDKGGKRGEGCEIKYKVRSSAHKYCDPCQLHADADRAQEYRDTHHDELLIQYREKGKKLRDQAKIGKTVKKIVDESGKDAILLQMVALYLKLHPKASADADVQKIFKVSPQTIRRARKPAGVKREKGRPPKSV
jgi:hypothetical protein